MFAPKESYGHHNGTPPLAILLSETCAVPCPAAQPYMGVQDPMVEATTSPTPPLAGPAPTLPPPSSIPYRPPLALKDLTLWLALLDRCLSVLPAPGHSASWHSRSTGSTYSPVPEMCFTACLRHSEPAVQTYCQ